MKSERKHDNRLKRIIMEPTALGLPRPVWIAKETRIYDGYRLIGEPDILLFGDNTLYNIEYKCNDTQAQRIKAQRQLQCAERFFRYIGYEGRIRNLMVSGRNFDVEVIQ